MSGNGMEQRTDIKFFEKIGKSVREKLALGRTWAEEIKFLEWQGQFKEAWGVHNDTRSGQLKIKKKTPES